MRASRLKTEKRVENAINRSLNIQTFGLENDYPQRLREIVDASATGSSCMSIYKKFIIGRGFAQADFYKAVIDSRGTSVDSLLDSVSEDLARFKGFALHVNYNALFQIVSVQHVPFEWLRFEALDKDGRFDRIALHPDWGKRNTNVKKFDAILGKPGEPGATPVDWDGLIPVTEKDGVEWYVVECERHFDDLSAVLPSYNFLKAKGLN